MRTILHNLFLANWQRKVISLVIAVIVWFVVSRSLITTKALPDVPIRIVNIPEGKTVQGLQKNGHLTKRLSLILIGNEEALNEISSSDFEVVIDASRLQSNGAATISKKNLVALSSGVDIQSAVSKVVHPPLAIQLRALLPEKLLPLSSTLPISLFFPLDSALSEECQLLESEAIKKKGSCYTFAAPLFVKGVSPSFLKVVQDRMQLMIVVDQNSKKETLQWSVQFINTKELEERFVAIHMAEISDDELRLLPPRLKEERLRARFQSYLSHFQLLKSATQPLALDIRLENNVITIK
jgi:hypothetical protein